jgi:hypothetical protein
MALAPGKEASYGACIYLAMVKLQMPDKTLFLLLRPPAPAIERANWQGKPENRRHSKRQKSINGSIRSKPRVE